MGESADGKEDLVPGEVTAEACTMSVEMGIASNRVTEDVQWEAAEIDRVGEFHILPVAT